MPLDLHRAPYGFVPVSEHVFLPPWAPLVSQDHPLEDGISGTFTLRVTAESPIFVRGAHKKEVFFQLPDGSYAIPGSSLKGALRNVVEIASFGWMRHVNRHRYGVRDLHSPELYGRHMADIGQGPDGKRVPLPKVIAGWLEKADGFEGGGDDTVWATIRPCSFAKIEYAKLVEVARFVGVQGFDPGRKQSSPQKYRAWGDKTREVQVTVTPLRPPGFAGLPYDYCEVKGPGRHPGTLVFTGQPSTYDPRQVQRRGGGKPKHHDFVFLGDEGAPIPLTATQFKDFEFVHSDRGQQNNLGRSESPNEEWGYWRARFERGERVPVFFLAEPGATARNPQVRAFGLAMMFRLAYRYTTQDAVHNAQPGLKTGTARHADLAETLFGFVGLGDKGADSLRGRVRIGAARTLGNPRPMGPETFVLGSPKASYFPAYVEQDPNRPGSDPRKAPRSGYDWKTYMDEGVRVRGWKRYQARRDLYRPPPPTDGKGHALKNDKVTTTFHPLPGGTEFEARVAIHNVRPVELGALMWAITLGGEAGARHTLGLARPLGFGLTRLAVAEDTLTDITGAAVDVKTTIAAFEQHMEAFAKAKGISGGWRGSPQVRSLLAMATPVERSHAGRFRYMSLKHPEHRNEFAAAKLDGKALPAPVQVGRVEAVQTSPATGPSLSSGTRSAGPSRSPSVMWKPLTGGTVVSVELFGKTKKEKWKCRLVDGGGEGILVSEAPPDAGLETVLEVVVVAGGNPRDMQFKWEG